MKIKIAVSGLLLKHYIETGNNSERIPGPEYDKYKQNRQGFEQSLAIHKLGKFNPKKA